MGSVLRETAAFSVERGNISGLYGKVPHRAAGMYSPRERRISYDRGKTCSSCYKCHFEPSVYSYESTLVLTLESNAQFSGGVLAYIAQESICVDAAAAQFVTALKCTTGMNIVFLDLCETASLRSRTCGQEALLVCMWVSVSGETAPVKRTINKAKLI